MNTTRLLIVLAALGLLASSALYLSCPGSDPDPAPAPEQGTKPKSDPDVEIIAGFPVDRHRGRSVQDWITDIEGDDRFKCFRAIVAVGEMEQDGVLAVPAITRVLLEEDSDDGLKRKAIASLGRIAGPQAIQSLETPMRGPDEVLGYLAADAYGAMGSEAVDKLVEFLASKDDAVRSRAARGLKGVLLTDGQVARMDAAVVPLAHALADPSEVVRGTALDVLSELGPRAAAATPVIIEKLEVEKNSETRKLLMVMVGMFGEQAAGGTDVLRRNLADEDPQIRLFAALALAKVGHVEEGLAPLLDFLESDDHDLQMAAADALRRIGPPAEAAVEPLKQARKGADDNMHLMIEQALKAIRGQS